jgi:hypothetical protein
MKFINTLNQLFISIGLNPNQLLNLAQFNSIQKKYESINIKTVPFYKSKIVINKNEPVVDKSQIGIVIKFNSFEIGIRDTDIFLNQLTDFISWDKSLGNSIMCFKEIIEFLNIKEIDRLFIQAQYTFKVPKANTESIDALFRFYPETYSIDKAVITSSNTNVNLYDSESKIHSQIVQTLNQKKDLNNTYQIDFTDPSSFNFGLEINTGVELVSKQLSENKDEINEKFLMLWNYSSYLLKACLSENLLNQYNLIDES